MNVDQIVRDWFGTPEILAGLAIASVAAVWMTVVYRKGIQAEAFVDERSSSANPLNVTWMCLLVAAVTAGALARFIALDQKGLSHPEIYIPGLNLPPEISVPPARHAFVETASWHFRYETHPFGYYLAMWAWTKTFGASVVSIRLPAVLLGTLSLFLVYRVAALTYSPRVGVVAAGLLALHGAHVFWSQAARMYVPGAFLGLLSTWLLLKMTGAERPRPGIEAAYVLTTIAGTMTVEFFWPLLGGQILWTALGHRRRAGSRIPRTAVVQTLALILSAPMFSHGAMVGRNGFAPAPGLVFLRDYFSFGFLFQQAGFPTYDFEYPMAVSLVILAASLALIVLGLRVSTTETPPERDAPSLAMWPLTLSAIGIMLAMLGIAGIAYGRRRALAGVSILPLLALLIPVATSVVRPALARMAPRLERWLQTHDALTALVPLLALVPALAVFAVSYKVRLTAPRAFLMFVPYLLVVVAAGAVAISRSRFVGAATGIALLAVFSTSVVLVGNEPISSTDYQGLAHAMNARLQAGDLIFTRVNWAYTPIYLYLDSQRFVATAYEDAVRQAPGSRVWLMSFLKQLPEEDAFKALSGYRLAEKIATREAEASLYVPKP